MNKGYQSINMSNLASEGIDIESFEDAQTLSGDVAEKVKSGFDNVAMSGISMVANENSDKEQ